MGRLFINNQELDLPPRFRFARTKQVNEIGRLDNRQANYTQRIRLPKTKRNVKAFNYLGTLGNSSNVPYTVNSVRYVNDSGVDEIFDGIAIVKNTNNFYNLAIYDGFISFTKAIENRVLTDADLSELNHLKNLDSVINTWSADLNYKYLIADYNGNAIIDGKFNIDFLIPSVNVKYLWDKVHEFAGYTYEGSVFNSSFFENLWITYPKSIGEGTQQVLNVFSNIWTQDIRYFNLGQPITTSPTRSLSLQSSFSVITPSIVDNAYLRGHSQEVANILTTDRRFLNNVYLEVKQNALFKITVAGTINRQNPVLSGGEIVLGIFDPPVTIPDPVETRSVGSFSYGEAFNHVFYTNLEAGQYVDVMQSYAGLFNLNEDAGGNVTVRIEAVTGNTVDFEEAFIDFEMQDFVNEVLWRFSLTPFKSKYTNHIQYLSTAEWLQTNEFVDWSARHNKFIERRNENYIISGYAQRNYLRYKYNDDNFAHNDGFLTIDNKNLRASTNIISSNLFSPEPETSNLQNIIYNIYPLWQKEPQEDGEIKYKELENRFYIMQSEQVDISFTVTSGIAMQDRTVTGYQRERFGDLAFDKIVENHYRPLYSILNGARIITAIVFLNDNDMANLDFRKLVYIREEGSYFIINKIPNYIEEGEYNVELIEVDRLVVDPDAESGGTVAAMMLSSEGLIPNNVTRFNWAISNTVLFQGYTPVDGVTITATQLDENFMPTGVTMTGAVNEADGTQVFELPLPLTLDTCGTWRLQANDPNQGITSNQTTIFVPCPTVVNEPAVVMSANSSNQPSTAPIQRAFNYEFVNFTPTTATLTVQAFNLLTGTPIGVPQTITGFTLNQDTLNTMQITLNQGSNWYTFTMVTNEVTQEISLYIL